MVRAITTLNFPESSSCVASAMIRWVTLRSALSPAVKSVSGPAVLSCAKRQARARNFCEPCGETSAQSTSSSGGEANTMVRRTASTPNASSCSPRSTPLPSDLDIALPPLSTWPWLSSALNGSWKPIRPKS